MTEWSEARNIYNTVDESTVIEHINDAESVSIDEDGSEALQAMVTVAKNARNLVESARH